MFNNIKIGDYFIVLILVLCVVAITYLATNRIAFNKLLIKIYPAQSYLELRNLKCSDDSPLWLKDILEQVTRTHQSPNNQIAYINKNGKISHCENGYLGLPLFSQGVTSETRFRFASVTKLFTSDAILTLIKNKQLKLDTPILEVLNDIPKPQDTRIKSITVEDLLLHRAGFNRTGLMGDEMFRQGSVPFCPNYLSKLSSYELSFEPKKEFAYSNLGYCLLGMIVENKIKSKFDDYLNQDYHLANNNIKFLKNFKYSDEAKYRYIETSLTGYGDIYSAFDYASLASSAGLSGNALQLAKQVKNMISKPKPNILSQANIACDLSKIRDCYGYAMFPYQRSMNELKVYFRDGVLPGASSLVVITEKNEIFVLLSSGQAADSRIYDQTKMLIYDNLAR